MTAVGSTPALLSTGVPALDHLLGGGLPVGGLTLVYGPSGSGKSVLAHQLCRARPNAARYLLAGALPPDAVASRHAEPRPAYLRLSVAPPEGDHEALHRQLGEAYSGRGLELVIVDTLEGLWVGEPPEVLATLCRLVELCWEQRTVTVALASPQFVANSGVLLTSAACCLMELERGDGLRGRRLRVHKLEGRSYGPGDHPFTIGPLGLKFDSGVPAPTDCAALSSLGARILNAFRTSRRATPSELAALLGHETEAIESALDQLACQGYLAAEQSPDGQLYYSVPRPS